MGIDYNPIESKALPLVLSEASGQLARFSRALEAHTAELRAVRLRAEAEAAKKEASDTDLNRIMLALSGQLIAVLSDLRSQMEEKLAAKPAKERARVAWSVDPNLYCSNPVRESHLHCPLCGYDYTGPMMVPPDGIDLYCADCKLAGNVAAVLTVEWLPGANGTAAPPVSPV